MQYVYINAEPGCYTVGFYTPAGDWEPESDHPDAASAAARAHYLNGGSQDVTENDSSRHALKLMAARVDAARDYCRFICSMEVWGHGPVEVARAVQDLLGGGTMPEDAAAWLRSQEEGGSMANIGRPPVYTDDARVFLSTTGETRLQPGSERRAIVNKIVDNGGSMTLAALDEAFGYVVRDKVIALVRAGWVKVEP